MRHERGRSGRAKCEAEYDLDTFAIRRLDTGAPLATKEAKDARAREASIAEVQGFLADVFGR